MHPRENIEAAFSPGGASAFGAVLCYEGIFIRDHWGALTARPWHALFSPALADQLAWRRDVIRASGQDWFAVAPCETREDRRHLSLQIRPDGVFRVDARTNAAHALRRPAVSGWNPAGRVESNHSRTEPRSLDDVLALFPESAPFDTAAFHAEGRADLADALVHEHGAERLSCGYTLSPLWRVQGPLGFEAYMTLLADRPDWIAAAVKRALEISLQDVRRCAALGARAIWIEECMTDMIAPALFARLNVPVLRRLCEEIRALGMAAVYYYCGGIADRFPLLLDCGADALGLEESKKGFRIDIGEVAEAVHGRCALLGNLDAIRLLEQGSEAELRAELRRQARAGRRNRNRFVFSLGSPVTPATPVARVRLFTDLAHEAGRD